MLYVVLTMPTLNKAYLLLLLFITGAWCVRKKKKKKKILYNTTRGRTRMLPFF